MGILDEAIRQHLELKRKHGADEDEIQELEDSAFGPPERPGTAEIEALAESEPVEPQAEAAPPPGAEGETALMPTEPEPEWEPEPEPEADAEQTPAELARQEYSQLQDTHPHEPVSGPEPVQSTEEQDALEMELFEAEDEEDVFDVGEVDLDIEDDLEPSDEGPGEPQAHTPPEDTPREHEVVESGTVIDPDPTDESAIPGDDAHDMLEETPEFLKDAPESDEAWFEQDEPEDFDFD